MSLTLDEAFELLNNIDPNSSNALEQLYDIVEQLDVVGGAEQTFLYSGNLSVNPDLPPNALHTGQIVEAFVEAIDSPNSRLEGLGRGNFMNSAAFKQKLAAIAGFDELDELFAFINDNPTSDIATNWNTGWDDASRAFAEQAQGNVIVAATNQRINSVFATVELPALLDNADVTSINGIDKELLRAQFNLDVNAFGEEVATRRAISAVEVAFIEGTAGFRVQLETGDIGGGVGHASPQVPNDKLRISSVDGFSRLGSPDLDGASTLNAGDSSSLLFEVEVGSLDQDFSDPDQAARAAETKSRFAVGSEWLQENRVGVGRALDGLGVAGDLLGLYLAGGQASDLLEQGDRDGAGAVIANELGSIAGGTASAFAFSPLLAFGPIGWVTYGVVVVASSYGGGEAAEAIERNTGIIAGLLPEGGFASDRNPFIEALPDGNRALLPQAFEFQYDSVRTLDGRVFENPNAGGDTFEENSGFRQALEAATFHFNSLPEEQQQYFIEFFEQNPQYHNRQFYDRFAQFASGDDSVVLSEGDRINLETLRNIFVYGNPGGPPIVVTASRISSIDGGRPVDVIETAEDSAGAVYDDGEATVVESPDVVVSQPHEQGHASDQGTDGGGADSGSDGDEEDEIQVARKDEGGQQSPSTTFAEAGAVLGSILGSRIAGNNKLAQPIGQAVGVTLTSGLGFFVDGLRDGLTAGQSIERSLDFIVKSFPNNLFNAGKGALSSYLTAELINAVGLDGVAGQVASQAVNPAIGQIINNIIDGNAVFSNLVDPSGLAVAAASLVGNKLADEIYTPDTIGGQIGGQVAAALYVTFIGKDAILASIATGNPTIIAATVAIVILEIAVFKVLGSLIGSVFGGTPRSGADVVWDDAQGRFVPDNAYSRKGGSKEAAVSLASGVSDVLNTILEITGAEITNPEEITTGNYGLRKRDLVYRPTHTRDKRAITYRVSSKKDGAANEIVNFGIYNAISDVDFRLVGGNLYTKRAFYNITESFSSYEEFDAAALIGAMSVAVDYERYVRNKAAIDVILYNEPDSVFALEIATLVAQARDLGITTRHESDWFCGFDHYFGETSSDASNTSFSLFLDGASGQVIRSIQFGRYTLGDAIDIGGQTTIETVRGDVDQVVDLRSGRVLDQRGYAVNDHLNDDIAVTSEDFAAQSGTPISFDAGALRTSAIVAGLADTTANEEAEKFLGQISGGNGVSIVGGAAEATIIDGTAATPTLLVGRSYALESDGHATFRLSLSKAATSAVSVDLATAGVSAVEGEDYSAGIEVSANGLTGWTSATSATFAVGQTQLFARVAVLADNNPGTSGATPNIEGNERFVLTASVTAGASAIANEADAVTGEISVSGTGTIVDASVGSTPLAWIDSVTVDEASGQAVFSIARSNRGGAASVNFSTADTKELVIDVAATVDAGGGNDTVHASDLGDNIFGGEGDDTLYGGRLDDWLLGGAGNDVLNAGGRNAGTLGGDGNYLNGGDGDDLLIGREGSDWLEGGDGADTLEGGDGGDVLAGGAGDGDVLRGGRGDDRYIFRLGDGEDVTRDESGQNLQQVVARAYQNQPVLGADIDWENLGSLFNSGRGLNNWVGGGIHVSTQGVAAGGEDVLVLGQGIGLEDIKISKSENGEDLIIELAPGGVDSGDRMTLQDWFTSFNKVEILRFADGNEVRIADFDTFTLGTDGDDTIIGTVGNDFVHAGNGNDLVHLLSGNDFGNGGLGDDTVSGDRGNDIVLGSVGNDTLIGGRGHDNVSGGQGNDALTGDQGDDILAGGQGDDEIIGGEGNDVFKFQRGDGRDTIIDALTDDWEVVWAAGAGFGAGYSLNADGSISHVNDGLLLEGTTWTSRIRHDVEAGIVERHVPANADAIVRDSGNDILEFGLGIDVNHIQFGESTDGRDLIVGIESYGGSTGSFASLEDQIILKEWGSSGSPGAYGSIESFVFFNTGVMNVATMNLAGGTDGDDDVVGVATSGNWLTGGAGDDTLTGGDENDILNGNSGADRLLGGAGSDVLLGGTGNDVLIGGAGGLRDDDPNAGDLLIGGSGLDTASYETALTAVTASLLDSSINTGDAAGDSYSSIENLRGSDLNDTLEGDEFENELTGGEGNDTLRGAGGDDLYVFGRGDGNDLVIDQLVDAQTTIVAGGSSTSSGPALVSNLQPPYVSSVRLADRNGANYQFEHIVTNTESGEIVYRKEFEGAGGALPGEVGHYEYGYDGELVAPATLDPDGWVRNDDDSARFAVSGPEVSFETSYAGAGSDTILFEDYTGNEGVSGDASISLSDLSFAFNGNDLVITVNNGGGSVTLQNFRTGANVNANQAVETLQFSDGSSFDLTGLRFDADGNFLSSSSPNDPTVVVDDFIITNSTSSVYSRYGDDTLLGGDAANILRGGDGDDFLVGGLGADRLYGDDGVDTVSYSGSDAAVDVFLGFTGFQTDITGSESSGDRLYSIENVIGSHFDDALKGSNSDNVIRGMRGEDVLTGGTGSNGASNFGLGDDVLIGGEGNDTARGGVGYDNLEGGDGNDILEGGGDGDILVGGDGDDILRGDARTTGTTTITEFATDSIGANQFVNHNFEDLGDSADNASQSYGVTTDDLPGWTKGEETPFALATAASGVTAITSAYALLLDSGTNQTVSQSIDTLAEGDSVRIALKAGTTIAGESGELEVLWNGEVIQTFTGLTSELKGKTLLATAQGGTNTLTLRGVGTEDGFGAVVDNVRVFATSSADQLIGGAGRDRLLGGGGNDVLLGGEGDDHSQFNITAGASVDGAQTFAAGLYGGAGDDTLDGGTGNDSLDGGDGNDSYLFRAGSGNDTVTVGGGYDDLIFDEISSQQIWLRKVGYSLEITAIGLDSQVVLEDWFGPDGDGPNQARRIVTADQSLARSDVAALVAAMETASPVGVPSEWPATVSQAFADVLAATWQDNATYEDRAVIYGTEGDDRFSKTITSDPDLIGGARYEGLLGHDTIDARRYNADGSEQVLDDVLVGGDGTDTLIGGAGDDLFLFDATTRYDHVQGGEGFDTLQATMDNTRFSLTTVSGIEAISGAGFDNVKIYNSGATVGPVVLDLSNVAVTDIVEIRGNNRSDVEETIIGSDGDDTIISLKGDDTVLGGLGNDVIRGGQGNDTLDGGEGIDTYDGSDAGGGGTINISDTDAGWHATTGVNTFSDTLRNFENVIGTGSTDTIIGSNFANRLEGLNGHDTIEGGAGDDILIGGHGHDALDGGTGSDTASYEGSTGAVNVNLTGGASGGHATGDTLTDIENLTGSSFNDTLTGGAGDNVLTGGLGDDLLIGGGGDDTAVYSGSFYDYVIDGAVNNATVTRDLGGGVIEEDTLQNIRYLQFDDVTVSLGIDPNNGPRLGQPRMLDQVWDDGDPQTYVIPETAFYDLDLGDGMDFSATLADGSPLPSWLTFHADTRTFEGTPPVGAIGTELEILVTATDVPDASQSTPLSVSDSFVLTINEAAGVTLYAVAGSPLAGTFRSETMIGTTGNDTFLGSAGADAIFGQESTPPGGDTVSYGGSAEGVSVNLSTGLGSGGDAEGDTLDSIESVVGSAFDDTIVGSDGGDVLAGLAGEDAIDGGAGDDSLLGGLDADTLIGGDGNDTIYARASADGTLEDSVDGGRGLDTIILTGSDHGAIVDLSASSDNPISIENVTGSNYADTITGNILDNNLSGGLGNDIVHGGSGRDTIHGNGGDDIVEGGLGNDKVHGDEGNDRLIGGEGADFLNGGAGNDTVDYRASSAGVTVSLATSSGSGGDAEGDYFADGTIENIDGSDFDDILTGDVGANILKGFDGDDQFVGGDGNDAFDGGAGTDTIVYSGNREDYVVDFAAGTIQRVGSTEVDTFTNVEFIEFGDGERISANNQAPIVTGGLSDQSAPDNGTFSYQIPQTAFGDPDGDQNDPYQGLTFAATLADGSPLPVWLSFDPATKTFSYSGAGVPLDVIGTDIEIRVYAQDSASEATSDFTLSITEGVGATITGTANGETLNGTFRTEAINALAGDDTINSSLGADAIDGGSGVDLVSYAGSTEGVTIALDGSVGSGGDAEGDTLTNVEQLEGSALADSLTGSAGSDTINAGAFNDFVAGGAGNDLLYGEEGNDTLEGGEGNDSLVGGAGADVLDGGAGEDWAFYNFAARDVPEPQGVTVDLANAANNTGAAAGDTFISIENIGGSDHSDILSGDNNANWINAQSGDDIVRGMGGNDTLTGSFGSDHVYGGEGDDIVRGGDGDDFLYGEAGADTLDGGDGIDVILYRTSLEGVTINLETGAASGGDADGDIIVLGTIERVDGSDFNDTLTGSAGDNSLRGFDGDDTLVGGAGNDVLRAGDGDDTLIGGAGADALSGGEGFDTISYADAAAGATFLTGEAIGEVSVGSTMIEAAVQRSLNGVYVNLSNNAPADGIRAKNSDAEGDTFAADIDIEKVVGSSSADEIYGSDGNSVVEGGDGDDVIYGGDGHDELYGGAGSDFIFGQEGQDTIYGGDGNDRLFGDGASDSLYGGAGNDILDAGDSGDMLEGGTGDDILIGGLGDDQYYLTTTSGSDTIYNYASRDGATNAQDVVKYGPGINQDNLWFTKVAGTKDLRVKVLGHDSDVTIKDWFANDIADDFTNAGVEFVLRMFIASPDITTVDSLPVLLSVMADIPEPASFDSLTTAQRDAISNAWFGDTAPTLSANAGNVTSINEDGTATLFFTVNDNGQTPLASIDLRVDQETGAARVSQPITIVPGPENENQRAVTISGLSDQHGAASITLIASDGTFDSTPIVVNLQVNAVADGVTIDPISNVSGNNNVAIALPTIAANLRDTDGSEVLDFVRIEAIPVGAEISDGTNSFTATAGTTSVDVNGWNLSTLTVRAPAGSSDDFALTVRSRSRETSNGDVSAATTRTFNVAVNAAPTAINYTPAPFSETAVGSGSGGVLVATFTGVDPDGPAGLSYLKVGGADAEKFRLEGNQLYLKSGQSLDFEAGDAFVNIRVTDSGGFSYTRTGIAIRSTDVNEAPTFASAATGSVAENNSARAFIRQITTADPDGNGIAFGEAGHSISIVGGSSLFELEATGNANVWNLYKKSGVVLDYDNPANRSHDLVFRVTDNNGNAGAISRDQAFTVNVTGVNEAPTNTSPSNFYAPENSGHPTNDVVIGNLSGVDPEGVALEYSLIGAPLSLFGVNGTNLVLLAGQDLDHEAASTYSFTVRASDGVNFTDKAVTVNVSDVNERPHSLIDTDGATNRVTEGSAGIARVTIQATDPDAGDNLMYSLSGGNNWFSIDSTTGVISASSAVNYESTANGTVTLNVTATDEDGLSVSRGDIVINITDVNERPTFTSAANGSVNEAYSPRAFIKKIETADPDKDNVAFGEAGHTLSIVGGSSLFELVKENGDWNLYKKSGVVLDYDNPANRSHNLTIRVRDNNGNSGSQSRDQAFTVNVAPVNELPSQPGVFSGNINEHATGVVANVGGSTDPEGTTVSYYIDGTAPNGGNANGYFTITTSGQVRLNNAVDFENLPAAFANGYAEIAVVASDGVGNSTRRTGLIYINNINDNNPNTPSASGGTRTFNENSGANAVVATLSASDPDGSLNAISYELANNPGGMFRIVGNQLRVVGSNFNYEALTSAKSTHINLGVQVRATDGSRDSGVRTINVRVNNIDDNLPTAGGISGNNRTVTEEIDLPGATLATASASDADGDALVWSIVGPNPNNTFGIRQNGQIYVANTVDAIDYEKLDGGNTLAVDAPVTVSITVRAEQSGNSGRYVDQTFNLTVRDLAERMTVFENIGDVTAAGYTYGDSTDYDHDGDDWYGITEEWIIGPSGLVAELYEEHRSGGDVSEYLRTGYIWTGAAFRSDLLKQLPPIVFDLNGDGLIASDVTADFDIDGDGNLDRTGWISGGDAFLALDRDGNGLIDNGAEISFIQDLEGAQTDLEGLAAYDSNADGVFDANDDRFGEFLVWQDANEDGISQADELQTLLGVGIAAIDLAGIAQTPSDEGGLAVVATSTYENTDGTTGLVGDVALRWDQIDTVDNSALLQTPIAFDADGNGVIDPDTEVSRTVAQAAAFDSNGDSIIDANDDRYFDLRLWNNANLNDRAEPDELIGLSQSATPIIDLDAPVVTDDGATTDPSNPSDADDAGMSFLAMDFDRKAKRYRLEVRNGELFVTLRNANGEIDPRAGAVGGAAIFEFRKRTYGLVTPIILDLDGDGIDMRSRKKSKVRFDMDGNGSLDRTGWVGKGDGMLVIDRNNDGLITDVSELSLLTEDPSARSGFGALASLDENGDGVIDADDARFGELKVWVDANRNGRTDAGELRSLEEAGISEIGLAAQSTDQRVKLGRNVVISTATFTRTDGTVGTLGDVAFGFRPTEATSPRVTRAANSNDVVSRDDDPRAPGNRLLGGMADPRLQTIRSAFEEGLRGTQDMPSVREPYAPAPTGEDLRLAAMVQAMASFGGSAGDVSALEKDKTAQNGLDWLAASTA